MTPPPPLPRRLLAELLGSAFLAAVVIGSGIAAQQLSPHDIGLPGVLLPHSDTDHARVDHLAGVTGDRAPR